ncbi:MAG: Y-family DNA polymerase [Hyphomonas sp.]
MRLPTEIEALYIDFDSFFANAEKQLCPELRGRPVGVIPLQSEHSSLIACCPEAKRHGVRRGSSVQEAKELCPGIALPVARHDEYVKLHHRILEELDRHVPVKKVWSVDEMEFELIGAERCNAADIAMSIRAGLKERIGPWVTVSIGLAPNQFLAKVAAEMNKPEGFITLSPQDLPGPLLGLELDDLPGISSRMSGRLGRAGVKTVEQLWNLSPKQARAIWNSVEGERFWAQLRGYAVERPGTEKRMFGHGRILSSDWRQPAKARDCLRLLTAKAARRLRQEGYLARALNISISGQTDQYWDGGMTFSPSRDDYTFLQMACRLFDTGVSELGARQVRKVSVVLHGISRPGETSGDLFEQSQLSAERRRWERITDAMDALNTRNGACVVSLGVRKEPPGGYAGAKIAFGRVPDLNDFLTTRAD